MIYIIEKLWTDSLENDYSAAIGYEVIGYCNTEQEAKDYCESQGFHKKMSWPTVKEGTPNCRYKELNKL